MAVIDTIYVGDTLPALEFTAKKVDGTVVNLTTFGIDVPNTKGHIQFIDPEETSEHITPRTVVAVDLPNGLVQFQFLATDFTSPSVKTGKIAVWVIFKDTGTDIITSSKIILEVKEHP